MKTFIKKLYYKDIAHCINEKQSMVENINTITLIEHSFIPKIYAVEETQYEMEYINGKTVSQLFWSLETEKRKELIFKFISQLSNLINIMFKLKNKSFPSYLFIGKDMKTLNNYMIDNDGRIMCIDFDSWRWFTENEAILHARNAVSFPIEKLLKSNKNIQSNRGK